MVRGGNLQKGIYEPCQRAVHEEFVVESQVWAKTVSREGQRPIFDPAFMRLNFRSDWRHDIAQSALALLENLLLCRRRTRQCNEIQSSLSATFTSACRQSNLPQRLSAY